LALAPPPRVVAPALACRMRGARAALRRRPAAAAAVAAAAVGLRLCGGGGFAVPVAQLAARWSSSRTRGRDCALSAVGMATSAQPFIVLDPFAARNFIEPGQAPQGKAFIEYEKREFQAEVNAWYERQVKAGEDPVKLLKPGYADFCKHIFMPNFVPNLPDSVLPLNADTLPFLRSEYVARTEKELPVLTRWFPKDAVKHLVRQATHLDIILYSREQIRKANAAMGQESDPDASDSPWGIVSVKPQGIDQEIPMEPITMMRNALGVDQGGSGVAMDRSAYEESARFWNTHARVQ